MDARAWMDLLTNTQATTVRLPLPPSLNHYLKHTARGVFLTKRAKQFRANVQAEILMQRTPRFSRPVIATLEIHPTNRSCDLDNFEKSLWDALQHAGVLVNDAQVACVLRFWGVGNTLGALTLRIAELADPSAIKDLPAWTDQRQSRGRKSATRKSKNRKPGRRTHVKRYGIEDPAFDDS